MFTLLNEQKFIAHILKYFCPSKEKKKKCKEYFYKDTRAGPRLVKPKHIVKISNWSFKVIGNTPLKILKWLFPHVCELFATLEGGLQYLLENLFLSLKNGGIISLDPSLTNKSLMLNPLSAIKLSPNWSF